MTKIERPPGQPDQPPEPADPYEPPPAQPGDDHWKKGLPPNPRVEER